MDFDLEVDLFEQDIENLIAAIKSVDIFTSFGEDVKYELLNKLYNE